MLEDMQLTIRRVPAYGKYVNYPACDKSRLFIELIGQKTFTARQVTFLEKLGYTLNFVYENNNKDDAA